MKLKPQRVDGDTSIKLLNAINIQLGYGFAPTLWYDLEDTLDCLPRPFNLRENEDDSN